jgi:uncharacterized protein YjbI with pentapeptide repeats
MPAPQEFHDSTLYLIRAESAVYEFSRLAWCRFEYAKLEKANLKNANISGANLEKAKLTGAIMPDRTTHD